MAPKRPRETIEEVVARPWCYYCDRDFDDLRVLHEHQKAKHFLCQVGSCNRRLNTAGGLKVHMNQVHKEELDYVPNALPERSALTPEIFGMEGVPQSLIDARTTMVLREYHKIEADWKRKTGNPLSGTAAAKEAGEAAAKKRKTFDKEDVKRRVAERKAMLAAKKAGLPAPNNGATASNGQDTLMQDAPIVSNPTPPGLQAYPPPQMLSAPSFNNSVPAAASYGHNPAPVPASINPNPPPGAYLPAPKGIPLAMALQGLVRAPPPGVPMTMAPSCQPFSPYSAPPPYGQQPPPGLPARPGLSLPGLPGLYSLPNIPGLPARPSHSPQPTLPVHAPVTPQPSSDDIEALINSEHKKYLAQQEESEQKKHLAQEENREDSAQQKLLESEEDRHNSEHKKHLAQQEESEQKEHLAQQEHSMESKSQKLLGDMREYYNGVRAKPPQLASAEHLEAPEPIDAADIPHLSQTPATPATEKPAQSLKAEAGSKLMFSNNFVTPEEKKAQSHRYTIKQKPSMIQTSMDTQGAAGAIGNEVEAYDDLYGA